MTRKRKPLPFFENVTIEAVAAEGRCVTHIDDMGYALAFGRHRLDSHILKKR